MKNGKKTHWLRTTILVLAACGIVGLLLSAALFKKAPGPTYASATLVLTFDGAAKGIAPNGMEFDLRDLSSEEVLSAGLKAAGLEESYTTEQVRSSLRVTGVYPEDMAEQVMHYESLLNFTTNRELAVGDYHPTTFSVTLTNEFDKTISRDQLTALLGSITEAYRGYFARVYAYGLNTGDGVFSLETYDYPQQLEIIGGRLAAISAYARELYEKDPSFRFRGAGFNDISIRMDSLAENDIARLSADLTVNAVTKDTERMLIQYQYQIMDLGIRRDKRNQELSKLDKLIASYEKNEIIYLSTADSLMKIDENASQTYDVLVSRRKEVADDITKLGSQITNYELMIKDLLSSTSALSGDEAEQPTQPDAAGETEGEEPPETTGNPTPEELAAVEQRLSAKRALTEESIRGLTADSEAVIADFREMLEAYNARQLNELTVSVTAPVYRTPKLLSGAFIALAVKTAGPIAAIGFMVCMVLIAVSRKKEEKES